MKIEITEIHKTDENYPARMLELPNMPKVLYVTGRLPDEEKPSAAIVGARMCSPYGRETAYEFGRILAKEGVQVISGMAAGIDGYALEGALDAEGDAFAVLGSGVDICYPRSNGSLYRSLVRSGGILSEHPAGTPPLAPHFPSRNRIISALADIVIVVEAKARSGSLITVDFALSQGRTVFAVPGRVGDLLSDGCNYLIAQGAGIAYAPEAILKELQLLQDTGTGAARIRAKKILRHQALEEASAQLEKEEADRSGTLKAAARETHVSKAAQAVLPHLPFDETVTVEDLAGQLRLPLPVIAASLMELVSAGAAEEQTRGHFRIRKHPRDHRT